MDVLFFDCPSSTRSIHERVAEHKYAIKTNNVDYPEANYCHIYHNGNYSFLKMDGIEFVEQSVRATDRLNKLLQREMYWILNSIVWCVQVLMRK